jgi:hypothetical protein
LSDEAIKQIKYIKEQTIIKIKNKEENLVIPTNCLLGFDDAKELLDLILENKNLKTLNIEGNRIIGAMFSKNYVKNIFIQV